MREVVLSRDRMRVIREMMRIVMIGMRVTMKKRGAWPKNPGAPKLRIIPCNNLNTNHNSNNLSLRWENHLPHPNENLLAKCLLF